MGQVGQRSGRGTILVVDDGETDRYLLGKILRAEQYEVLEASNGDEALRAADAHPISLVLLDLHLPGRTGVEVCAALRARPTMRHVPVVMMTIDDDATSERAAIEAGADEYLVKPIARHMVSARVRSLLRLADVERDRERLRHARLTQLETLVSGVAHEVNNPLSVVLSGVHALRENLAELGGLLPPAGAQAPEVLDDSRSILDDLQAAGARVREMVKQLRSLVAVDEPDVAELDLAELARAGLALASVRAPVESSLQPAPVEQARRGELLQLVLHLLENAALALPEPDPARDRVRLRTWTEGGRACLQVEDTGPGIPAEVQARVFEPFFSTRPPGAGRGLGLSYCRAVADRLEGELTVASRPGQTAVTLKVPTRRRG